MSVNECIFLAGKEPVGLSSRKALSPVTAGTLRATAKEIFIVFVFSKEPIFFRRERIDVYFFTRFLRDSDDNLPPVEASQIFGSCTGVIPIGLVNVLIAIQIVVKGNRSPRPAPVPKLVGACGIALRARFGIEKKIVATG